MIYGFPDAGGRIFEAHNDDTVIDCPEGAVILTQEQFNNRFDWILENGRLLYSPALPPGKDRAPEMLVELAAIDAASARPLRAILVGSATDEDRARLIELDEQAAALRAELAALESPPAA